MKKLENVNNIDNYIAACPVDIQETLTELKNIIKKAAPEAKERISYQMPAFEQKGILVYFGAQKQRNHGHDDSFHEWTNRYCILIIEQGSKSGYENQQRQNSH
jgi:hypothetical protein